eukprot:1090584-Rhodomonas_salina.4
MQLCAHRWAFRSLAPIHPSLVCCTHVAAAAAHHPTCVVTPVLGAVRPIRPTTDAHSGSNVSKGVSLMTASTLRVSSTSNSVTSLSFPRAFEDLTLSIRIVHLPRSFLDCHGRPCQIHRKVGARASLGVSRGQEGLLAAAAGTEAEAAGVRALERAPRSCRSRTSSTGADVAPTVDPTAQAAAATLISGPGGDKGDRERMSDSVPAFESSPSVDASLGFSHAFPEAGQRIKLDGTVESLSNSTSRQAELEPPSQPNMPAQQKQVNFRSGV